MVGITDEALLDPQDPRGKMVSREKHDWKEKNMYESPCASVLFLSQYKLTFPPPLPLASLTKKFIWKKNDYSNLFK